MGVASNSPGFRSCKGPCEVRLDAKLEAVNHAGPEPVSAYWRKLGFPAMEITHGPLSDLRYRGQPGRFELLWSFR
jgi:hypothetical protein